MALMMGIWGALEVVMNIGMFEDMLTKHTFHSIIIFAQVIFLGVATIGLLVLAVLILVDQLNSNNNFDYKSMFKVAMRTDLLVALVFVMVNMLVEAVLMVIYIKGLGFQSCMAVVVAYLYPIFTGVLEFYYIYTLRIE